MTPTRLPRRTALIGAVLVCLPLASARGQEADPLADLLWSARPVVIFADSPRDPRLARQIAAFEREKDALAERDVVILTDAEPGVSRADSSALRKRFRPHDFTVIVVDKDGEVLLRRPVVISADDVTRLIDRTPLRLQETGRR